LGTVKKGLWAIFLAPALLLLLNSVVSGYELTQEQGREISFRAGQLLSVWLQSGEVRVHRLSRGKPHVRIKKWVEAATQKRAEERLAQLTLDFSVTDSGLDIRQMDRSTRLPLGGLLRSAGLVRPGASKIILELFLPRRASLRVVQKAGLVRIDSLQGNVEVRLERGKLRLRHQMADKVDLRLGAVDARLLNVYGPPDGELYVAAEQKRGRLVLRNCRIYRLVVRSNDGDVFLVGNRLVQGDIQTESGDIFLRPRLRSTRFLLCQTKSGDFFVKLAPYPACRLVAETGLGRIFSPYAWKPVHRGGGETLRLSNADRPEIRLISEIGDIFIQPLRRGR